VICDDELVALPVVVAQQVLSAAHVAEEQKDVSVTDRPEVWTSSVIADNAINVPSVGYGEVVILDLQ